MKMTIKQQEFIIKAFQEKLKYIFLALLFSVFATGCVHFSDGPYRGKILELETEKPIEGAVVAGVWHIEQYGGPGGVIDTFCNAAESPTDQNGEFQVPRISCWHWWPFSGLGYPRFTVFKPGYLGYPPLGYTFEERKARMPEFMGQEFRDKRKYEVIKLGIPKMRDERKHTLNEAESTFTPDKDSYDKMPILLKLVNEENKNLGFHSIGPSR